MTITEFARSPSAAARQADAAIAASGLRKHYGRDDKRIDALLGIDLAVQRGEVVGVLGPNGAGKTTLIEILEGVRVPDGGTARVLGVPVQDRAGMKRVCGRIGIASQHTVLPPLLTVRELLTLQRTLYASEVAVDELIDTLGLSDKARARVGSLSGGQQQRVAVALALVGDPELLFLDEPTSQLDPQARRAVWSVLEQQCMRRHATVLLTTHQMEEAQRLCGRILIIDRGRVIAEGSPGELVERHCPGRVISFTLGDADPAALDGLPVQLHTDGAVRTARLEVEDVSAALGALVDRQRAGRLSLEGLRIERRTLEDVFLQLTGRQIRG
ncbi:MAG: ABC transporter ATP-binding protein [Pseudomonadota bacterium]